MDAAKTTTSRRLRFLIPLAFIPVIWIVYAFGAVSASAAAWVTFWMAVISAGVWVLMRVFPDLGK